MIEIILLCTFKNQKLQSEWYRGALPESRCHPLVIILHFSPSSVSIVPRINFRILLRTCRYNNVHVLYFFTIALCRTIINNSVGRAWVFWRTDWWRADLAGRFFFILSRRHTIMSVHDKVSSHSSARFRHHTIAAIRICFERDEII